MRCRSVRYAMLCSDEEIPCREPVTKYKLKFSRDCGEEQLIVQRITMDPGYVISPKAIKRGSSGENNEVNNSPPKHKDTMNSPIGRVSSSANKSFSMKKSVDKLNDKSITDILCDSGCSDGSESDIESHVPRETPDLNTSRNSSEARKKWIVALQNEDLSPVNKKRKNEITRSCRGSRVHQFLNQDDSKGQRKVTPKKSILKIDHLKISNDAIEETRRSQRKGKTKYDEMEWNIKNSSQKNRRMNREVIDYNEQQSPNDKDSLDCQPLKRMLTSQCKIKNVEIPNKGKNRRVEKNAVESNGLQSSDEDTLECRALERISASQWESKIVSSPSNLRKRNRRVNKNTVELDGQQSSSDEGCRPLSRRVSVSQNKTKPKSDYDECEGREIILSPGKKVTQTSPNTTDELSAVSSSSDYDILKTKQSLTCNENKQNGNFVEHEMKGTRRKRVIGKPSAESNEETSDDEDIPLITRVKNKKVAVSEDSLKGLPVKSKNKTPVKDNTHQRNVETSVNPDVIRNKKNPNECTPKYKLIAPDINITTEKNLTPTTPSSRRTGFKRQLCTPSMPVCKRDLGTPRTPLQQAMTKLHVSAVPQSLPCREAEFVNIHRFLEGKILDGAGGCIYVSGVPGTGKTATVREVVRSLKQDVQKGDLPDFHFVEINGMRLSHPRQAYVHLWKALASETVTAEQAQRLLESKFTKSSKKQMSIVVLVDEVDVLWTKRQDVVYNLLDWPAKAKAHLVVITIANTMDLPERLLMGRVTSRLGLTRLTFQPYTYKQLEEIVKARLQGINAFDPDAIQFVARKVASVSGDARRALDICRRATEIAEQESHDCLVTIKHVDEALLAMTSSHSIQAIVHACSTMEKLFLQAVDAELTRTGLEETTFCKAYMTMETLCCLEGLQLPSASLVMKACMKLSSMRLLLSQHSNMDIYTRIFLNVSSDDLHYALKYAKKEL